MKSHDKRRDLDFVQISVASPDEIKERSYGEVTNSRSMNYKTMKPEKNGLFCETIFGTLKDYECRCGSLKGEEYEGKTCRACGVEVTSSRVRRYRMGHINLATPVPHVWFLKIRTFYLITLLGLSLRDVESIFQAKQDVLLKVRSRTNQDGKPIILEGSGCEVIFNYFKRMDLTHEYFFQRKLIFKMLQKGETRIPFHKSQSLASLLRRYRLLEHLITLKRRPEWLMVQTVSVLPPELRPFILMQNNLVVSSDLNLLYKKIIERNQRLKSFYDLRQKEGELTSSTFIHNELVMLQHAVDSLIDNGRRGKKLLNKRRLPLKSLAHILKGKEGRFRMNLLGKRVDLSARTVISVGPRLKLTQCGLPISIGLTLFKSIIYKKIGSLNYPFNRLNVQQLGSLNGYLQSSQIMSKIDKIVYSHPVLLNRAPTLHRLNIQAFQPLLLNNKAIQFHPLVCSSFNADFDGDQMAVHLPLSLSSQIESRILMMTHNNIVNPANGNVIIMPSQDVIFGIYYASLERVNYNISTIYLSTRDVQTAVSEKKLGLHDTILYYLDNRHIKTTPGRVMLYSIFKKYDVSFESINHVLTKKSIHDLIYQVYHKTSREECLYFLDQLMAYGFYNAHKAGISLNLRDAVIPSLKKRIVSKANKKGSHYLTSRGYVQGLMGSSDSKEQLVEVWSRAQDLITQTILQDVHNNSIDHAPPIYMLIHSGARGTILQMRQLSGLRGLMVKPSGDLIEMPIPSNFKEGLAVLEYFHSTHGARKGVIDTSIRTATSGYLTRRLVHAVQDITVTEEDCGSTRGIKVTRKEGQSPIQLYVGRVTARDIHNEQGELLLKRNSLITPDVLHNLPDIDMFVVRSPLTCQSMHGICQMCYGSMLTSHSVVSIGEAVGILASQSIGEPGTQLTMRTFHIGGVLTGTEGTSATYSSVRGRVLLKGVIKLETHSTSGYNRDTTPTISLGESSYLLVVDSNYKLIASYDIPYGSTLYCEDGDFITKGELLFKWNAYYKPVFHTSNASAITAIKDFDNMLNSRAAENSHNKTIKKKSLSYKKVPRLVLLNNAEILHRKYKYARQLEARLPSIHYLQHGDLVKVTHGQKVKLGDLLYLLPRSKKSSGDITGGLSKISQLFESAQLVRDNVLSTVEGLALLTPWATSYYSPGKVKWRVDIVSNKSITQKSSRTYIFTGDSRMEFRSHSYIKRGSQITQDTPYLGEVLDLHGVSVAMERLKDEITLIYNANGVNINGKHLELVLTRMFSKVEITSRGETSYMVREEVSKDDFIKENLISLSRGLIMASAKVVVRGVTYISLESTSFLSAAAFQNTSQVLTRAALYGKIDPLRGLSENVILGRLIPVGTGSIIK